ncbi:MAG: ABC transporter permease [Gammaproteobacteria bacterium]|nr:ABC transporter permease [Gammaproteobacteria bacterium]
MERAERRLGTLSAMPLVLLLAVSFLAPLVLIMVFSTMPRRVFEIAHLPDFSSYVALFRQGYFKSLFWSLGMALVTTVILFVVCWPLAFAMAKVFRRFTLVITIAVVMSLFISENIRLFGWVLTLMKGGLIDGHLRAWFGLGLDGALYNVPVIVFGLIYVYLPFMLFPPAQGIAMIPEDVRLAAADLGATRRQVLFEIDLPLAMPGIVVGSLLTFVLAAGALAEAKLLGGQAVIVIAQEVETAFTYSRDWPLGSALSTMLIVIVGVLAVFAISRINLDTLMGRRG